MRYALLFAALAGCAQTAHTSAIVSPTATTFEPARSDPAALALADAELSAVGTPEAWTQLQELTFATSYRDGGQVRASYRHKWDRAHGRHLFVMSEAPAWFEVRYSLTDGSKTPYGRGADGQLDDDSSAELRMIARKRLNDDGAWLTLVHRLHDPGVRLAMAGTINEVPGAPTACKPSCASVKVTFDPGTGGGAWMVDINTQTHKPELIEKLSGTSRAAFRIDAWTQIGALDWPTRLVNFASPEQTIELSDVAIGVPQDATYEAPVVDREQMSSVGVISRQELENKMQQMAVPCQQTCNMSGNTGPR